jgi:hypothetical protein
LKGHGVMNAAQKQASLAQPLRDAATYLHLFGWSPHELYGDDTATPPASLVGALAIACYGYPHPHPFGLPNTTAADPGATGRWLSPP